MSTGKVSSQTGHGVMMLMGRYHQLLDSWSFSNPDPVAKSKMEAVEEWLASSYRKVMLGADEKEWERLKTELDVFLVRDAGATEVARGSETVIVLWPMRKSSRPKFLKRMRALD
jgi:peptidyl-tRNA hydrolase